MEKSTNWIFENCRFAAEELPTRPLSTRQEDISEQELMDAATQRGWTIDTLTPNMVIELKRDIALRKAPGFKQPADAPQKSVSDRLPPTKDFTSRSPYGQDPWRSRKTTQPDWAQAWVLRNCKFAAMKTASIFDNLSPQEQARVIKEPDSLTDVLRGAYQRLGKNFSVPLTQQDIMMDLNAIDQRVFPGQGPRLANPQTAQDIMEIAKSVAPTVQPAQQAVPQQKQVVPDPFDQYRKYRGR